MVSVRIRDLREIAGRVVLFTYSGWAGTFGKNACPDGYGMLLACFSRRNDRSGYHTIMDPAYGYAGSIVFFHVWPACNIKF